MIDWKEMPPGREKYQAYLASREWAELREKIKLRSWGNCEYCGLSHSESVHHITYDRIYNENLEDLLDVCNQCHLYLSGKTEEIHSFYKIQIRTFECLPTIESYLIAHYGEPEALKKMSKISNIVNNGLSKRWPKATWLWNGRISVLMCYDKQWRELYIKSMSNDSEEYFVGISLFKPIRTMADYLV